MPVTIKRPVTEALKDARVFLSSVNNEVQPLEEAASARQALDCCCRLLEAILLNSEDGKSITLNSPDWTVVKAVLELVVRWGIYPSLNPGVGIPLEKRFGAKGAITAAAAVSKYIPGIGLGQHASALVPGPSHQSSAVDCTNLFQAAELLACLVLESTPSCEPSVSSPGATIDSPAKIDSNQPLSLDSNPSMKETLGELKGKRRLQEAALQDLMMFYHLPDLCAAYLQLAHSGQDDWRKLSSERMDSMVECLPVAHMVEALLTLLGQDSPAPPPWFKSEAGKLLSRLIMREGGVAAAIGRLVGGTQGGNVRVYDRIASHLAKPPEYVTTVPQYYKAVCPQLLPLLLLPFSQQENSKQVGSAAHMCVNMHHTAVIMACKLTARERALSEECLLRPLLQPLLSWAGAICAQAKLEQFSKVVDPQETNMQEEIHVSIGTDLPCGQTLLEEIPVEQRETSILNSLFGIQVLLTAGHGGAAILQQLLLQLIKPISPCILMLKILLEPDTLHQITDEVQASSVFQKLTVADNGAQVEVARGDMAMEGSTRPLVKGKSALAKGLLENARLDTSNEGVATEEPIDMVGRLRSAMSDIVIALNALPGDPHCPTVSLFGVMDDIIMNWPRADGEIREALEAGRQHTNRML
ncbi:unnamed protein product [Sphagnum jensenii]|uniref:TANGO6 HEAT repeat domain-containing protein n=1 Tax=Sphagnum jensenii TaxID=128206 RepID=A0ABP1AU88_9BRYO